ncbi:MAG TPA: hypothetical protein VIN75_17195 [Burkholderiaceae bacterium]
MLKIRPGAAQRAALPSRPGSGGLATAGTLILASVSAVSLVLLSGCHAAPASRSSSAFAATSADKAAEARLAASDAMPPVQPFDEHLGAELAAGD